MMTPRKNVGWLSPGSEPQRNRTPLDTNMLLVGPNDLVRAAASNSKGKTVALVESAVHVGSDIALNSENFVEKISKLEQELFDYQFNMGLLLIEKKEWDTKNEELNRAYAEAMDTLKREQAAHVIALSDAEKREDNLRKALGVEKQCLVDLERAVREMRAENAEIKFIADSKLAEANALETSIEEKSLEIEAKLRSYDAKLAEVNRKNSDIERKLQDMESREISLRRERLSFVGERDAHESDLFKQRDELREWEKKLQEGEERLSVSQRFINQQEERANENDKILKRKETELEEAQNRIDDGISDLRKKEEETGTRLTRLILREKEFDAARKKLEIQEEELHALEVKLNDREKLEIQKLTDEHNAIFDVLKSEFEMETEKKRKQVDDELKNRVVEVEKKEAEMNHREDKILKREQAIDNKLDKIKEKEREYESKSSALKEAEKELASLEKNTEGERKLLQLEREKLRSLKAEVEKIRQSNEQQLMKLREEKEQLRVTAEERENYVRLQAELKEQTEKSRVQEEVFLKECEDLKQQKESFEREWEELDEKRLVVGREMKRVSEEKAKLEKKMASEEESMKKKRSSMEEALKREAGMLELARESFEATMEHEQAVLAEKIETERTQMGHLFELQKRELENDLQKKQEEAEKKLHEKERILEEERERELKNLASLRDSARREMEEVKSERRRIEREKQGIDEDKKLLEGQQGEMREDIEKLGNLSCRLREHREEFAREKARFVAFVEKQKSCRKCGESISEFVISDLVFAREVETADIDPKLAVNPMAEAASEEKASASPVSWIKKCTSKLFSFSPGRKAGPPSMDELQIEADAASVSVGAQVEDEEEVSKLVDLSEVEPELSFAVNCDSTDHVHAEDKSPDEVHVQNIKPKVHRNRTMMRVVRDAKAILGNSLETLDVEVSRQLKGVDGHAESSSLGEKDVPRKPHKRSRAHASQTTLSELGGDESDGHCDGVVAGKTRKKPRGVPPAMPIPKESRYNLRRTKLGATVVTAKVPSDMNKKSKQGRKTRAAQEPLAGISRKSSRDAHLVPCEKGKRFDGEPSEEVTGTPERAGESGHDTDREEEDDVGEQHPGEASIGKKLWTFFTT